MTRDKKPLALPNDQKKRYTEADLVFVAETAAKKAVEAIEQLERKKARQSDPGRAAQRMLSDYRRLKIAQKEDIQISEAEGMEMRWKYLEDLMGTPDHAIVTEATAYARERKLQYNQYKIQQIEAAMAMYEKECAASGNEEFTRRYRVLKRRYIDEVELSAEDIAEKEGISVRSVYNDSMMACKVVAVYLSAI